MIEEPQPSVMYLRLIDGTNIIGSTFSAWDDDVYVMEKVLELKSDYKFMAFMPGVLENLFTFKRKDVMIFTRPSETLTRYYYEKIKYFQ